jgi:small subunit ribosomal protein S2
METDGTLNSRLKKEASVIRRQMIRMHRSFEGIVMMDEIPSAMFVVDVKTERIAVAEAKKIGIPVVAIVDTNSDPNTVKYPIPGNDDSSKSVKIIIDAVIEAIAAGQETYLLKKQDMKKNKKVIMKDEMVDEQSVVMDEQLTKAAETITIADEIKAADKATGKAKPCTPLKKSTEASPKEESKPSEEEPKKVSKKETADKSEDAPVK